MTLDLYFKLNKIIFLSDRAHGIANIKVFHSPEWVRNTRMV